MPRFYDVSGPARRYSRHRRRAMVAFLLSVAVFFLFGFKLISWLDDASAWNIFSDETLKTILARGLPAMALAGERPESQKQQEPQEQAAGDLWQSAVYTLTRVDVRDPKLLLATQMAFLETGQRATPVSTPVPALMEDEGGSDAGAGQMIEIPPANEEPPPGPAVPFPATAGTPLVGIYNTHNAETYLPTDKKDKLEGKNAGVSKVAAKLQETLETRYGVKTVRSETIHDYPDWAKSYANSERTVREMLSKNPGLQVLLDIHRDAGLSERQVVKVNGLDVAKVLLIIGSNTRLQHPYWKQNLEFAGVVAAKMESLYPGMSKGVRVQDGRYNQHMHPRAILVEVGSSKNSLEEAQRAAELVARVVFEVLKDMAPKKSP